MNIWLCGELILHLYFARTFSFGERFYAGQVRLATTASGEKNDWNVHVYIAGESSCSCSSIAASDACWRTSAFKVQTPRVVGKSLSLMQLGIVALFWEVYLATTIVSEVLVGEARILRDKTRRN